MRPKLRVALLGQGFMGRAHSNAWHQVGRFFNIPYDIETKLICGRNQTALAEMASTWGWAETAADWREAIARPDIDIIDVSLPNSLHVEASIAAAEAGKIVLCEKPLANTLADAERMAAAVKGRPNLLWHNYRRVPAVSYAHQLIAEGRIGRPYHWRSTYLQSSWIDSSRLPTWKTDKSVAGSGAIGDLMSHSIDLALWLNGPIESVCAMQKTFAEGRDIDDATIAMVRFRNGSVGTLEVSKVAVGLRNANSFAIHGDKGMLRYNLEDFNHLEFFDATDPKSLQAPRNILIGDATHPYGSNFWRAGHVIGYEHTFIAALGDFLQALASGAEYHPNFEDGVEVLKVIDAMEQSARQQRWVIL